MALVAAGSHVTLHYRLAVVAKDGEREVVSTLAGHPATLQIGAGNLAPELERRLIGIEEGACATFDLAAEEAFGRRSPDLVQALTRRVFDQYADPGVDYHAGDVLEFNAPNGGRIAGVLKDQDSERVVVDFNHPLAGMPVRFSVHVIGVL
jgi:FKBP-type peptidyl-prolyl cis-trans isomerase SlpA